MCIEINAELELVKVLPGDIYCRHLELQVHDSPHRIRAEVLVDQSGDAAISSAMDGFGLNAVTREHLVLAIHRELARFMGMRDAGHVTWVSWVEPDVTPWLRQHLYEPTASKAIERLTEHSTITLPRFEKGYTESLLE